MHSKPTLCGIYRNKINGTFFRESSMSTVIYFFRKRYNNLLNNLLILERQQQVGIPCHSWLNTRQYFKLFGIFDVTNALMFTPAHLTVELSPQYVFQSESEHLQRKIKLL